MCRFEHKLLGLLIILGPILILTGLSFSACSLELVVRLSRQIRRVMDPSLLKTSNLHEVKHWIEPGQLLLELQTNHRQSFPNHGEGSTFLFERVYLCFHIQDTVLNRC